MRKTKNYLFFILFKTKARSFCTFENSTQKKTASSMKMNDYFNKTRKTIELFHKNNV